MESQLYIDKTNILEDKIRNYPVIYMEGAAATGKTTVVEQFLRKHPDIPAIKISMSNDRQNTGKQDVPLYMPSDRIAAFGEQRCALPEVRESVKEQACASPEVKKSIGEQACEPLGVRGVLEEQAYVSSEEKTAVKSFAEQLLPIKEEKAAWLILEDLPGQLPADQTTEILSVADRLSEQQRIILISREKPQQEFLSLLWKGKMEILSQQELAFTGQEVERLLKMNKSRLKAGEVMEETGGWPGSVSLMLRMSLNPAHRDENAEELRKSYEITAYLQREILDQLTDTERDYIFCAQRAPWLNEALCEQWMKERHKREILDDLTRKGLLHYVKQKKYWTIAPLLRSEPNETETHPTAAPELTKTHPTAAPEPAKTHPTAAWSLEQLGRWYEEHGHIKEALQCYRRAGAHTAQKNCMIAHYDQIPYMGISYRQATEWPENTLQSCYLRGMYYYEQQNFRKMAREIRKVEEMAPDEPLRREILLNLQYANPEMTLDQWLDMLQQDALQPVRLYHMIGHSHMPLCGLRDLAELFACTKKEENRRARIWKENLGQAEWDFYRLARIDYYLETRRKDQIKEEEWRFVREHGSTGSYYLLLKYQKMNPEQEILWNETSVPDAQNTQALRSLYSPWIQETEQLTHWLREAEQRTREEITEDNYDYLCSLSKGYMLLNQYKKVEKLLGRLLHYVKSYKRERFTAELLFQQAIISWRDGQTGQALQNMIESLLTGTKYRYVELYAGYGRQGIAVLENYIEWRKKFSPEDWKRKKKYQYGNVLRMPEADYLDVIMRNAKKSQKTNQVIEEQHPEEMLTLMESVILQEIGQGLSNSEICEKLNLKLPTVKTHLSSLYKKLGVNNRTQAVLKGKELERRS